MKRNYLLPTLLLLFVFVFLMLINISSVAVAFCGVENSTVLCNECTPLTDIYSDNASSAKHSKSVETPVSCSQTPSLQLAQSAKSVYLIDWGTQSVIYERNANKKLPIASMSKIMTTLLTLEAVEQGRLNYDDIVVVSPEAAGMGGSQIFLDAHSKHSLGELLKAVIVCSANDASVALAEAHSGSENAFVAQMNKRAKELGMKNTHFANCTGLPAAENFSCAKDVATMTKELIAHKKYFDYSKIWLEDYTHPSGRKTTITNTNKLVRFYRGCDGGKTGYTSEAKYCLSATAVRNNMRLIAVVIGVDNSKVRFAEVSQMLNFAFANYENKVLHSADLEIANTVEVVRGKSSFAKIVPQRDVCAFVKKSEEASFDLKFVFPQKIKAPLKKGETVGKIVVLKNNVVVEEIDAILFEDILKANYFDDIKRILREW